jgi:hypothetical protein
MEHHPIVANSVLCFHLWIAGDSLGQYLEHHAALLRHDQHDDITSTSNDTISANKKNQKKEQQPNGQHQQQHKELHTTPAFTWDCARTFQCASYGALATGPLLVVSIG